MDFKKDFFKNNWVYFLGYFTFVFTGLGLIQFYGRDNLHLSIIENHSPFYDTFFLYFTDFAIPLASIFAFYLIYRKYDYKTLLFVASAFVTSTLASIFIKRLFFEHIHRPMYYFMEEKNQVIHIVDGVSESITYTFPSGHSTGAFLIMLFISNISPKNWQKFICFFIALLVAYSRVYLSKHFLIDTIGGATLGVFTLVFFYYAFQSWNKPKLERKIMKDA